MDVARSVPLLPFGRYLLASLTWNKQGSKVLRVLRVKKNTNSVPDQQSLYPDGQCAIAFYTRLVPPVVLVFRYHVMSSITHVGLLSTTNCTQHSWCCYPRTGNGGFI